jgi:DHA1 family inner membrane transport protein
MKRASAIATMFTGLTVATVTGVPLGTFIGQHASWRISFVVIAVIGLIGLISNAILVPKELPMPAKIQRGSLMRMIKAPVVLLSLIVTADGYGASFPVYSYMTTIIADQGWSDSASVIILIAYGLAVAVGNTVGGRVANAKPLKVLMMMFAAMIPMMLLMLLMLVGLQAQIFGLILILIMGLLAFMNVPGLQLFTMQAAEKYTPNDVQMASAFNIAAFNLGIMIGSYVGGIVADGAGLYLTPIAGSVMAAIALGLTWLLSRLHTA